MTRRIPYVLLAVLLGAALPSAGQQRKQGGGMDVWLSASQGVARVAIALPEPAPAEGLGPAARDLAEIARNDLYVTGIFDIVDPALYGLVAEEAARDADRLVRAKRWAGIGARYLVDGKLTGGSGRIVLEAFLVELGGGDPVLARRYEGSEDQVRDIAHALADDLLGYWTGERGFFTSRILYVARRGEAQEVFLADYDGGRERQLTRTGSRNLSPTASPDGRSAAFTSFLAGEADLYLADLATGEVRPLFARKGTQLSPAWCPAAGSDRIAFSSSHEGNPEIYVIGSSGAGLRRLTHEAGIDVSPTWSPSCREIAFVSDRSGAAQLYAMDAEGANLRRLTTGRDAVNDPAWSPDGSAIAYARSERRGPWRICVLRLASGEETCLPGGVSGESPTWSPDGRFLAFVSGSSPSLYVGRADGSGPPRRVQVPGIPKTPEWVR